MGLEVFIEVLIGFDLNEARIEKLSKKVLEGEGVIDGELSVVFVVEEKIREMNHRYRGVNSSTDVLSFSIDSPGSSEEVVLLGDVLICPAIAARNAKKLKMPLESEVERLAVHGILHVLGYDHGENPDDPMLLKQEAILESFNAVEGAGR